MPPRAPGAEVVEPHPMLPTQAPYAKGVELGPNVQIEARECWEADA